MTWRPSYRARATSSRRTQSGSCTSRRVVPGAVGHARRSLIHQVIRAGQCRRAGSRLTRRLTRGRRTPASQGTRLPTYVAEFGSDNRAPMRGSRRHRTPLTSVGNHVVALQVQLRARALSSARADRDIVAGPRPFRRQVSPICPYSIHSFGEQSLLRDGPDRERFVMGATEVTGQCPRAIHSARCASLAADGRVGPPSAGSTTVDSGSASRRSRLSSP